MKSLINQQHSSFASFKPGLKDGVNNYIKALKTPGEDIFWSLLSDIESLLNVHGSFLSSGEIAVDVKCAIFRCGKLLVCIWFLCNYPNVHIS